MNHLKSRISIARLAIGTSEAPEPFPEIVDRRFLRWLGEQERLGREFTAEQVEWLEMIKEHIATSVKVEQDDFESPPFYDQGGLVRVQEVFCEKLETILDEMNTTMACEHNNVLAKTHRRRQ